MPHMQVDVLAIKRQLKFSMILLIKLMNSFIQLLFRLFFVLLAFDNKVWIDIFPSLDYFNSWGFWFSNYMVVLVSCFILFVTVKPWFYLKINIVVRYFKHWFNLLLWYVWLRFYTFPTLTNVSLKHQLFGCLLLSPIVSNLNIFSVNCVILSPPI